MSDTSYNKKIGQVIEGAVQEAVLKTLHHLENTPPDEIYDNIAIMIKTLEGKTWSQITKEVYHSSEQTKKYTVLCVSPHETDETCEHRLGEECVLVGECNWREIEEKHQ